MLVKSDGEPTYLLPDIAYHRNKFERGYAQLIDIWGADHHGYVPRMKAGVESLGRNPEDLDGLLIQFVKLLRDGWLYLEPPSGASRSTCHRAASLRSIFGAT